MNHETQTVTLLDQAAGLMHAAAAVAESRGGDDVFSEWHGLASQIRLTSAGVSHAPSEVPDPRPSVTECLASATASLGRIAPLAGPADLTLWIWHIRELRDLAEAMERR